MDWEGLLKQVVPVLVSALGVAMPFFLVWLKKQKVVQKLHLEELLYSLIPQVVEWVEEWALRLVDKPSSEQKLDKALSLLKANGVKIDDNELKLRIEAALTNKKKEEE